MDVRMDGRVAAITGASTGLGLAMAREFAASGASVALLARKADALAAAKAEVANGQNEDVKRMAQTMIDTQQAEIAQMNQMLKGGGNG